MKFPLDVIKINNKIVLLKGQITKQFIEDLNIINDKIYDDELDYYRYTDEYGDLEDFTIRTNSSNTFLNSSGIIIDERIKQHGYYNKTYTITNDPDDESEMEFENRLFDIYKGAISYYKEIMGYE